MISTKSLDNLTALVGTNVLVRIEQNVTDEKFFGFVVGVGTEWLLMHWWETCQRGDWMRWLSQAATKVVGCNWTWNKHDRMCTAWTVFAKKEGIDAAYDEAIGKILLKDGLGNIKEEDEVRERYVSLQASFLRSIQPTPPTIPGLENRGFLWLSEWPCLQHLPNAIEGLIVGYAIVDESLPELEIRQSAVRETDLRDLGPGEAVYEVYL